MWISKFRIVEGTHDWSRASLKMMGEYRAFALWLSLFAGVIWGQDGLPQYRATSKLVLLDVQVIHNKTKTSRGEMQAKDFDVFEDGVKQEISFFDHDQLPLSVVLLFDLTDSVRGVLHRLAGGAQTALDHLKPEDEVAVMTYAASTTLVDDFTRDHSRTAAVIGRAAGMKSEDAAFFNEAVYQAAAELDRSANPSSRRVILWFTDNLPNVPNGFNRRHLASGLGGAAPHTEAEAIRKLHEAGVVVMPLLLKDPVSAIWGEMVMAAESPSRKAYPPGDAHKYAELTGGFAAGMRGKDVDRRLGEAIDSLRARYTIGYRPADEKPEGTFCRLKVTLSPGAPIRPQEWNVLVRDGYYRK